MRWLQSSQSLYVVGSVTVVVGAEWCLTATDLHTVVDVQQQTRKSRREVGYKFIGHSTERLLHFEW